MRKPPPVPSGRCANAYLSIKVHTKSPRQASLSCLPRGKCGTVRSYFFGVSAGFFSGVALVLTFVGVVPLPGEAAGEGEVAGVEAGVAVATGVAVAVGLTLLVPLLLGLLLQAPRAAVAARTELIMNDLLIVFLLCPPWAN
jgi:hypothetical protein